MCSPPGGLPCTTLNAPWRPVEATAQSRAYLPVVRTHALSTGRQSEPLPQCMPSDLKCLQSGGQPNSKMPVSDSIKESTAAREALFATDLVTLQVILLLVSSDVQKARTFFIQKLTVVLRHEEIALEKASSEGCILLQQSNLSPLQVHGRDAMDVGELLSSLSTHDRGKQRVLWC
ncbi:hypothetical protein GOP47_0007496 [Adiantum capillus-veneris]|uniref:Uncharacterized protein n=1 Tax=Adiantum capillus-veneris TaxID=13818 RepID=A0A9D4V1M7_ADICA|nr:hypothetical protein GOP47_0007496 [Adiantum capillus-veneris]